MRITLISTLLLSAWLPSAAMAATNHSSVESSVSVSASGGNSSASVRTVVNGEVVEDTTITSDNGEPIEYQSVVTDSEVDATTSRLSNTTTPDQSDLESLLNTLRALVARYVTLLSL